jgi:hypothetical protein
VGIGRVFAAFFAGWGTGVVSSSGRGQSYRLWRWSGIADRNGDGRKSGSLITLLNLNASA